MKNKKLTYVLGVAVLAIWGIITYRVVSYYTGQADDDLLQPTATTARQSYDDYREMKDTTRLQLNYPDPFGKKQEAAKDTAIVVQKHVITPHAIIPSAANSTNWSFIRYSGYIRNPGAHTLIAILTLNGREVTLKEGESLDRVRLLKNLRDSIRISYNGQTKYITLDHNP